MKCPRCDDEIVEAVIWNRHEGRGKIIALDATPGLEGSNVLTNDGRGVYLTGTALIQARRLGLPLYRRHAIHCRNFWSNR